MNNTITIPFFTTLKGISATVEDRFGKTYVITDINVEHKLVTIEKGKPL